MALSESEGAAVVDITIRDVPPHVRDDIARRAQLRGQSTQEFLLNFLTALAKKPDKTHLLARIEERAQHLGDIDVMSHINRSADGRYE
jgi:GrpB-like predicted nucleotidyltransferase (UPF0157 family)